MLIRCLFSINGIEITEGPYGPKMDLDLDLYLIPHTKFLLSAHTVWPGRAVSHRGGGNELSLQLGMKSEVSGADNLIKHYRFMTWQLTPVFLPEKSHGQRSLAGYSPKGRKESDTTE